MKKFSNINEENTSSDKELEMGIKIESEHCDIYEYLDSYLETWNIQMPCKKKEFY